MSTAPGIEKITIGLPLTVSGMVIVGIVGLLKSKIIRKFPLKDCYFQPAHTR